MGSVAHLHLKGAPTTSHSFLGHCWLIIADEEAGETPQVAAAGTDMSVPRSRQAPSSLLPVEEEEERSLGASPEGPHCGTLKSVYIGQRRLFLEKKRGMLARQYRRSSENGDYWRLELIYTWHSRDGMRCRHPRPPSFVNLCRDNAHKAHIIVWGEPTL